MFSFFRQKKSNHDEASDNKDIEKKAVDNEIIEKKEIVNDKMKGNDSDNSEKSVIIPQEAIPEDDMVRDLAVLVGKAITTWEKKYGLENLPRDIALDQAISILVAARDAMK